MAGGESSIYSMIEDSHPVRARSFDNTVGPRNNSPAFKGSPSIKVNILRSQMIVFNVILPLFKGNPEIKVKNLQSQWDRWGGVLLYLSKPFNQIRRPLARESQTRNCRMIHTFHSASAKRKEGKVSLSRIWLSSKQIKIWIEGIKSRDLLITVPLYHSFDQSTNQSYGNSWNT